MAGVCSRPPLVVTLPLSQADAALRAPGGDEPGPHLYADVTDHGNGHLLPLTSIALGLCSSTYREE